MRRRAKVDKNQTELVSELRQCGFSVLLLHQVGGGCPDLIVGRNGVSVLVEVKTNKGSLTEDQVQFFSEWQGRAIVAITLEDILEEFEKPCG